MAKLVYASWFIEQAQECLRKMLEQNLIEYPFGRPFNNMLVVIDNPNNKKVVAEVDIQEDLIEKIGNEKVFVVLNS